MDNKSENFFLPRALSNVQFYHSYLPIPTLYREKEISEAALQCHFCRKSLYVFFLILRYYCLLFSFSSSPQFPIQVGIHVYFLYILSQCPITQANCSSSGYCLLERRIAVWRARARAWTLIIPAKQWASSEYLYCYAIASQLAKPSGCGLIDAWLSPNFEHTYIHV